MLHVALHDSLFANENFKYCRALPVDTSTTGQYSDRAPPDMIIYLVPISMTEGFPQAHDR
jgi:hypothetical protein